MSIPNADHALDLHEGGGTSTPHGEFPPALELPGRFVVGPDAQMHGIRSARLTPGTVVDVNALSPAGSALCWIRGHFVGYVDPRHLTPAPEPVSEPAAAPAVDDALLYAVWGAVREAEDRSSITVSRAQRLLASEPMRRLRAAWTATVAAQRDQYADDWEAAQARCNEYVGQIGELTTTVNRLRSREGDLEVWLQRIAEAFDLHPDDMHSDEEVVSNLEELRSHRDDLALRVDQQNEELGALRRTNPSTTLSAAAVEVVRALNDAGIYGDDTAGAGWPWIGKAVRALTDEVERLRAAQQLPDCGHPNHGSAEHRCEPFLTQFPDVGPVTRDGGGYVVDGERYPSGQSVKDSRTRAERYLRMAARRLALAAHIEARDAEAANTSRDDGVGSDPVDWVREAVRALIAHDVAMDLETVDDEWVDQHPELTAEVRRHAVIADALDAHRARGGQENE